MLKKNKNIIANGVIFIASLIFFIYSFSIKLTNIDKIVGSRIFPQVITLLLMGFSLALIVMELVKRKDPAEEKVEEKIETEDEEVDKPNYLNSFLVFASFAIYLILLQTMGFIISSIIYLFSQMYLLALKENRTPKQLIMYAIISVIITILIYLTFAKGFKLVLPRGSLF